MHFKLNLTSCANQSFVRKNQHKNGLGAKGVAVVSNTVSVPCTFLVHI